MNDMIHSSNCIPYFIKRLGSPVVIALRSRPEDWWFKPWVFQIYFSFLFINFFSFKWIQLFPVKKRAQKLFVQFHYFNVFMYVSIIYDKKQESKVLGHLSRLSFNFWTGWFVTSNTLLRIRLKMNSMKQIFPRNTRSKTYAGT